MHLAPVDAIEVEQIVDEAIHLPAAVLDHLMQRLAFLVGEVELVVAPDRLHRTQDAGQRSLEIMRDRMQQRVLDFVQLTQVAGATGFLLEQAPLIVDDRAQRVEQHRGGEEYREPHDAVPVRHGVGGARRRRRQHVAHEASDGRHDDRDSAPPPPRFHVTSPIGMR